MLILYFILGIIIREHIKYENGLHWFALLSSVISEVFLWFGCSKQYQRLSFKTNIYVVGYDNTYNVNMASPIFFTLDNNLPIMVIPNVKVHMDGHTVLTYTYNIFFDSTKNDPSRVINNEYSVKDKLDDPDYYGFITFENSGRL
ncbi:MAG TPA: hypothetical protein VGC01_00195, partial [Mucilaginibacter sp.]